MAKRPGLYANMNARKKAGTSRSKAKSTVSSKAYSNMRKTGTKGAPTAANFKRAAKTAKKTKKA